MTRERMLRFTRNYKDTIQKTGDFDVVLLQIYLEYTYAKNYPKIELGLTKSVQKYTSFFDSHCR